MGQPEEIREQIAGHRDRQDAVEARFKENPSEELAIDLIEASLALANALISAVDRLPAEALGPSLKEAMSNARQSVQVASRFELYNDVARGLAIYGIVLTQLGMRSNNPAPLRDAVDAFRESLKLRSKEHAPDQWATTQNNLANALQTLGAITGSESILHDAVSAYRSVLEVRTREKAAALWGRTQSNLGVVLRILGKVAGTKEFFDQSEAALLCALNALDREASPALWANAQTGLGNTLLNAGRLTGAIMTLTRAETAHRKALETYSQIGDVRACAMTQNNIGNTLQIAGRITGIASYFERAEDAYRQALDVFTFEATPADWATAQQNLGAALHRHGGLTGSEATLARAEFACRKALKLYDRRSSPKDWSDAQSNLGNVLRMHGKLIGSTAKLQEATKAYLDALESRRKDKAPLRWVETQANLGEALLAWRRLAPDGQDLHTIRARRRDDIAEVFSLPADHFKSALLLRSLVFGLQEGLTPADMGIGSPDDLTLMIANALREATLGDEAATLLKDLHGLGDALAIDALSRGDREAAILYIEALRAKGVAQSLFIRGAGLDAEERENARGMRRHLAGLDKRLEAMADADEPADLLRSIEQDRRECIAAIDDIYQRVRRSGRAPEMQPPPIGKLAADLAKADGLDAIAYLALDQDSASLLILKAGDPILYTTVLPDGSAQAIHDLFLDWTRSRAEFSEGLLGRISPHAALRAWNARIEAFLPMLWEALARHIDQALLDAAAPTGSGVAMILPGQLALLPWGAAKTPEGAYFLERWLLTAAPSAVSLAHCLERAGELRRQGERALAVTDPLVDLLPDIAAEGNPIDASFAGAGLVSLTGASARTIPVVDAMPGANVISFYCHGNWNSWNPELSGILLAPDRDDEEPALLSVRDIRHADLDAARLVLLGACDSGLPGITAPDEMTGLPSAFIEAGVPAAIGTLWPVVTDATHRICTDIVAEFKATRHPARALQAALKKSVRGPEGRYGDGDRQPVFQARAIIGRQNNVDPMSNGDALPPNAPVYWAPFTLVGW